MLELFEFLIYDIVDTVLDIVLLKVIISYKKDNQLVRVKKVTESYQIFVLILTQTTK